MFRRTMLPSEEAVLVAQQHLLVHLVCDLAFFHLGLLEYSQLSILPSLLLTAPEPKKKKVLVILEFTDGLEVRLLQGKLETSAQTFQPVLR